MHRRPLGRGRLLAAVAAIVILVGCVLPWWQIGGGTGLPTMTGNAFEGGGIVVVFAALGTIALVTLPYATDRPVAIDRVLSYVGLVALGWIGLVLRVIDLASVNVQAMFPDRGPGLWLTAAGLILLARATYEIAREPRYR
jgi:hypothetical protein